MIDRPLWSHKKKAGLIISQPVRDTQAITDRRTVVPETWAKSVKALRYLKGLVVDVW